MSNLDLDWLRDSLPPTPVIFHIGCADITDSVKIKRSIPEADVWAFDCDDRWREQNQRQAPEMGIHYHHIAISDTVGLRRFYPSHSLNGKPWPWSGSVFKPGPKLKVARWQWAEPYTVISTTLEEFCRAHCVIPHMLIMDIQGAEFAALSGLGELRPLMIWTETTEFTLYQTGHTFTDLTVMMQALGYMIRYQDTHDCLFVLASWPVSVLELGLQKRQSDSTL